MTIFNLSRALSNCFNMFGSDQKIFEGVFKWKSPPHPTPHTHFFTSPLYLKNTFVGLQSLCSRKLEMQSYVEIRSVHSPTVRNLNIFSGPQISTQAPIDHFLTAPWWTRASSLRVSSYQCCLYRGEPGWCRSLPIQGRARADLYNDVI